MTTNDTKPLDVAAIRARAEAATNGPWTAASDTGRKDGIALVGATADRGTGRAIAVLAGTEVQQRHRDATFIAAARADVPALLDALAAAYAEIEALYELRRAAGVWRRSGDTADGHRRAEAALIEAVDKLTEETAR